MLLTNVKASRPRLALSEAEIRNAVENGSITDVILHGMTPAGFHLEGVYHPDGGLPVTAVLVNRSGAIKTIKCPDRALQYVHSLGIVEFDVDVSHWDPVQAFDPARESFLSRRRRQHHESALARLEMHLGEPYSPAPIAKAQQRLDALTVELVGRPLDATDLRALTLCWCDVHLRSFPVPERASKALLRFAVGAGLEADELESQLFEYCSEEFKRRCKNQYLASLDLGPDE
jgi:hypothetical protein